MKKAASVVFMVTLLCYATLQPPLIVKAESLYIRKIVSIVYDDSGSMANNGSANWAYANYAFQAFCGLLNSDDQLYVTYMSDAEKDLNYDPPQIDLDALKVQDSVDSIRQHAQYGNTPYSSIDVAFNKLLSVEDSNINTQYWLVIITDGEFQSSDGNVSKTSLDGKLRNYLQTQMPNGSTPQISYLAIGTNVTRPEKNEAAGLFVYESSGADDIVNTMFQIADKVSGRSRLATSDIAKKDARTIEISSAVPLVNIAVLGQKTTARIASITGNGTELSVIKSTGIKYPERHGWNTDYSLIGVTFLINNANGVIPTGSYEIKFDSDISLDDVVIMFEPALELSLSIKINGAEVTDLSELSESNEKDRVEISCQLFEIGTSNEVSPSLLPPDTVYELSLSEDGKAVQVCHTKEMRLPEVELHHTTTEVFASVHIKGFNPIIVSSGAFTPQKTVQYSVEVDVPDNFTLSMSELKNNRQKIYFIILANGVPLDAETVKTLPFSVETEMSGKVEFEGDGRVSFLPEYREPADSIPTGMVDVNGVLFGDVKATATICIKAVEYSIYVDAPVDFRLTMAELKKNTQKIYFTILADGKPLDADAVKTLPFSVETEMPGKIEYENDGRVSFLPIYQEPASMIPTGDVNITGELSDIDSATVTIYVKPLEYVIKAVQGEAPSVNRTELRNNTAGVQFEVFVDGEKLDKESVELVGITCGLNSLFEKTITLNTEVKDDGTVMVIPTCDRWHWLAAYSVPTGSLEITVSANGSADKGIINITKDFYHELIWNWLIPLFVLLITLGEIFKRRFKYASKIHYNHGESTSSTITGPISGWNTSGLFTPTAFIPFFPDVKTVNGAKFYAKGFFWNPTVISVKTSQQPPFSGTLDGGVNELESVRFNKNDISEFEEGEKNRDMIPGNVLVTSADRNYRSCQIYLYSDT